jgi:hypothetical protein
MSDCLWLANDTTNNGLPMNGSNINTYGSSVKSFWTKSEFPPTAAILTPNLAALAGSSAEFEVKVYPEESAKSGVSGAWSASDSAKLTVVTGFNSLLAAVSPLSPGTAKVLFNVASGLFGGDYKPQLSAFVTVRSAPTEEPGEGTGEEPGTEIEVETWTEIGGEKYYADGGGIILLPRGASVANLPIWIETPGRVTTVTPDANGNTYNFTNPVEFTITSEGGTERKYTVKIWPESNVFADNNNKIVDETAPSSWSATAAFMSDGSVVVNLWMPIPSTLSPEKINRITGVTAKTEGFEPGSVTFAIVRGDNIIRDFSGFGMPEASAPNGENSGYMLLLSAVCASAAQFESARIDEIVYRISYSVGGDSEEQYTQQLGVTVADTSVTRADEKQEENENPPGPQSSDGGCDTGAAAYAALGIAAVMTARGRKKK